MEMVSIVQTNRGGRRRKIEMKKIEKKTSLEVAFSKRRAGLFKKAGEICILCGAQVAVIVFSPGKKVYTFGHPSVDDVLDRLLHSEAYGCVPRQHLGGPMSSEVNGEREREGEAWLLGNHGLARGQQYSLEAPTRSEEMVECGHSRRQYMEALKMLQVKKGKRDGKGEYFWWDLPFENMGFNELEQFKASLEELRKKGISRLDEMMTTMMLRIGGSSPSSNTAVEHPAPPPPQQYCSSYVVHGSSYAIQPQEHASPTFDVIPDFGFGL